MSVVRWRMSCTPHGDEIGGCVAVNVYSFITIDMINADTHTSHAPRTAASSTGLSLRVGGRALPYAVDVSVAMRRSHHSSERRSRALFCHRSGHPGRHQRRPPPTYRSSHCFQQPPLICRPPSRRIYIYCTTSPHGLDRATESPPLRTATPSSASH